MTFGLTSHREKDKRPSGFPEGLLLYTVLTNERIERSNRKVRFTFYDRATYH